MQNCGLMPEFDVQPRVYVRKLGGEYTEIIGIQSFERSDDDSSSGNITFVMADKQDDALKNILTNTADKYVDVKMEFSIGMLMVMQFSGFVETVSSDTVCIAMSTPITTNVVESPDSILH